MALFRCVREDTLDNPLESWEDTPMSQAPDTEEFGIELIEEYRGVALYLDHWRDGEFPYYIAGEFWLDDTENTYDAQKLIIAEARKRGAVVSPDSELSQFFFNAGTAYDARILIDVLHDQGRVTA